MKITFLWLILIIGLIKLPDINAQEDKLGNIFHFIYDNTTDNSGVRRVYITADGEYMVITEFDSNLTALCNGNSKVTYVIENANYLAYKLPPELSLDLSRETAVKYVQAFGFNHRALEEKLTKAKETAQAKPVDIRQPSPDNSFFKDAEDFLKHVLSLSNPADVYQFIYVINMVTSQKKVLDKLYLDNSMFFNDMALDEYDRYHRYLQTLWKNYDGGWLGLKEKGAKIDFHAIYSKYRAFEVGSLKIVQELGENIDILKEFKGTGSPILDIVKVAGGIAKNQNQC